MGSVGIGGGNNFAGNKTGPGKLCDLPGPNLRLEVRRSIQLSYRRIGHLRYTARRAERGQITCGLLPRRLALRAVQRPHEGGPALDGRTAGDRRPRHLHRPRPRNIVAQPCRTPTAATAQPSTPMLQPMTASHGHSSQNPVTPISAPMTLTPSPKAKMRRLLLVPRRKCSQLTQVAVAPPTPRSAPRSTQSVPTPSHRQWSAPRPSRRTSRASCRRRTG